MTYRSTLSVLAVVLILLAASQATARSSRTSQVPNNEWGCALCHNSAVGGGPRNAFGQQVEQTLTSQGRGGKVQWGQLFDKDADGDGYTNGQELGDPMGQWERGDSDPQFDPSNPADSADTPCGNGTVEGPEECDGSNLDGKTCGDVGESGQGLQCNAQCEFDTSKCGSGGTSDTGGGQPDTGSQADTGSMFNDTGMGDVGGGQESEDGNDERMGDDSGCSTTGGGPVGWVALSVLLLAAVRRPGFKTRGNAEESENRRG